MLHIQSFVCGSIGENAYLITDSATGRAALIDPGTASRQLMNALRQLPPGQFQMILLTHGHFDHIGGAAEIQQSFAVPVICHEQERDIVARPDGNLSGLFGCALIPPKITEAVYDGGRVLLGETAFLVLHTPGHTPGSVCYLAGDRLFSGDTLFCGGEGRTDLPHGSSVQMRASLLRLGQLHGDCTVYPGHGEPTTLSAERRGNPWMNAREGVQL